MGATSVTGTGKGSAGVVRGPGNNRNQYMSLLDAKVVLHGSVVMDGPTATIELPSTLKKEPEYLTMLVAGKGVAGSKNLDGDGLVESFTVFSPKKKAELDYVVVECAGGQFGQDLDF